MSTGRPAGENQGERWDSSPRSKLSEHVARRIVDMVMQDRLPPDSELWTEAEAMRMLGVSRGTFREAIRQLEWQGVVTVRRGVGGGLRTSVPRAYVALFTLKLYFELAQVDARMLRRSYRLLQAAMDCPWNRQDNAVLRLFAETADGRFTAALAGGAEHAPNGTRLAEQTAYRITLEIEDGDIAPGSGIGSEAALIQRFGVGRGVMREALRLMELNRVIEVRRGVGGGVFAHRASPDFAIHVCGVYLALAHIPVRTIVAAQMGIMAALSSAQGGHGQAVDGDLGLAEQAVSGGLRARALGLHAVDLFMAIFQRFWDEFRPDLAAIATPISDASAMEVEGFLSTLP